MPAPNQRPPVRGASNDIPLVPADPFWANVVLLLQNGVATDLSPNNTVVTVGTGATVGETAFQYNGLNSFKMVGGTQTSSIRFAIPNLGSQDWTWEIAWNVDAATAYWYADNVGNNASGLRLQVGSFAGNRSLVCATNTTGTPAPDGVKSTSAGTVGAGYPVTAYLCAERVGRYIYLSIDGVVVGSLDLGYAGYVIQNYSSNPRIGQQVGVANSWTAYAGQCRMTLGVARYGGANFTPPTAAFPVGTGLPAPNKAAGLTGCRLTTAKGILGKSLSANSLTLVGQRITSRGGIAKLLGDQAVKILGQRMVARLGAMIGKSFIPWEFSSNYSRLLDAPSRPGSSSLNTLQLRFNADGSMSYQRDYHATDSLDAVQDVAPIAMLPWTYSGLIPEATGRRVDAVVEVYADAGSIDTGLKYAGPLPFTYAFYSSTAQGQYFSAYIRVRLLYGNYPHEDDIAFQGIKKRYYTYEIHVVGFPG